MEPAESRTQLIPREEQPALELPHYYKQSLIILYVIECLALVKYIWILMSALTFHQGDQPWAFVLLICSLIGVILLSYAQSNTKKQLHLLLGYLIVGLFIPLVINILGVPEILRITAELLKNKEITKWITEILGLIVWIYYYTLAIYIVLKCIFFFYERPRRFPAVDV